MGFDRAFRFVVVRCCLRDGLFLRVLAGFGVPVGTGCAFRPVCCVVVRKCPLVVARVVLSQPFCGCVSVGAGVV